MKHEEKDLDRRCEAWTLDQWFSRTARCSNRRALRINGKELCGRHAMMEALAVAVIRKEAVPLPFTPMKYQGANVKAPTARKTK